MKIVIIGLGSIGQRHLRNLIKIFPDYEIIAVRKKKYTPLLNNKNEIISGTIEKKYKIKVFDSLKSAFKEKPTVAYICNPTSLHINYAIKCAQEKIHIFLEKPLSNKFVNINKFIEIVRKNKIICMIGFQLRFNPAVRYIKKILKDNKIGEIIGGNIYNGEYLPNFHRYEEYKQSYASREKLGGGVVLTQIHEIDFCNYFFGLPSSIYATGGKLSKLDIDVEDYSNSILSYTSKNKKKFSINLTLDYLQNPPYRKSIIVGTDGTIFWDYFNSSVQINYYSGKKILKKFKTKDRNEMFIAEIKHFIHCIKKKQIPISNITDGIETLKIALAIKKSMENNKIVYMKNK